MLSLEHQLEVRRLRFNGMKREEQEQQERWQNYVYQRDTMWSLLMRALDDKPDYWDETIFKLCVFDNVEYCFTHNRVCHEVFYHFDGKTYQTYRCLLCEDDAGGPWEEHRTQRRLGLYHAPYGKHYKRRVREVSSRATGHQAHT